MDAGLIALFDKADEERERTEREGEDDEWNESGNCAPPLALYFHCASERLSSVSASRLKTSTAAREEDGGMNECTQPTAH